MKHARILPAMCTYDDGIRFLVLLYLLILSPAFCFAAGPSVASRKENAAAAKKSFMDGAALFIAGDAVQGERVLTATNRMKEGTGAWHLESAQRFYELALYFKGTRQHALVPALATAALGQLGPAVTKLRSAGDTVGAAKACELEGRIHDSLRGEPLSALRAYEKALQFNPSASRAEAEVGRLSRVVDVRARTR